MFIKYYKNRLAIRYINHNTFKFKIENIYNNKMDVNNNYINEIKTILPKNMKKEKIEHIEKIVTKILNMDICDDEVDKYNEKIKKLKKENTQLRLDNLKFHEEKKKIITKMNEMHEIILKLDKNNKELTESNDDLIKIVEKFEKIDINNTVGIYTEE